MAFYRKNRGSLTYGTDQASDVNKISIIWYSIFRETEARIHEQTQVSHCVVKDNLSMTSFMRQIHPQLSSRLSN